MRGQLLIREEILDLSEKLPPLLPRKEAAKLAGLSVGRLANLDSEGIGPRRFRSGRQVYYKTIDFLSWMADRASDPGPAAA